MKIALLLCSRQEGNPNSNLVRLLNSIRATCADPNSVEVLVKLDDDDPGVAGVLTKIASLRLPFRIETMVTPPGLGYLDLHKHYGDLLPLVSLDMQLISVVADDVVFRRGWARTVSAGYEQGVAQFGQSRLFVLHQDDRYRWLNPCPDAERATQAPDPWPMWTREWLDVCGGFGPVAFTDAWTACIEVSLRNRFNHDARIILGRPILVRRLSKVDLPGSDRYETVRRKIHRRLLDPVSLNRIDATADAIFAHSRPDRASVKVARDSKVLDPSGTQTEHLRELQMESEEIWKLTPGARRGIAFLIFRKRIRNALIFVPRQFISGWRIGHRVFSRISPGLSATTRSARSALSRAFRYEDISSYEAQLVRDYLQTLTPGQRKNLAMLASRPTMPGEQAAITIIGSSRRHENPNNRLGTFLESVVRNTFHPKRVEVIFRIDEDDDLTYFLNVREQFKNKVNLRFIVGERVGYPNNHRMLAEASEQAAPSSKAFMIASDDCLIVNRGWDIEVEGLIRECPDNIFLINTQRDFRLPRSGPHWFFIGLYKYGPASFFPIVSRRVIDAAREISVKHGDWTPLGNTVLVDSYCETLFMNLERKSGQNRVFVLPNTIIGLADKAVAAHKKGALFSESPVIARALEKFLLESTQEVIGRIADRLNELLLRPESAVSSSVVSRITRVQERHDLHKEA